MNYARQRRKIRHLTFAVISAGTLMAAGIAIAILYHTAVDGQKARLTDTANAVSRLVAALAQADAAIHSEGLRSAPDSLTLARLAAAHDGFPELGRTGEVVIALREDEAIRFVLGAERASAEREIPWSAPYAEPMRQALAGHSGTHLGADYRGHEVLAAYAPIAPLGLGVVAKVDLAELRAPFIRAGGATALLTLGLALVGTALYRRHTDPLLQRLEEDEVRYRTLFDLSPHGILLIDAESRLPLACNKAALNLFGDPAGELTRHCLGDFDANAEPDFIRREMGEILHAGSGTFEAQIRTREGQVRRMRVRGQCTELNRRKVLYCILEDVTERVATEEELARHREHLEELVRERTQALEAANLRLQREIREREQAQAGLRMADIVYRNTSEGVFVTDRSGTILTANPAFTTITGYSNEEAVGNNPRILKSDHQDKAFYDKLWSVIRATGRWQGELWNRRKDGEAYLQWLTITAVRDEAGELKNYVAVLNDITELRRKEEHIRHQAYHDALTGLPNRMLFHDRLQQALARAHRCEQMVAVMFMDLDRFKVINDTLGHDVGDMLLQAVGQILVDQIREEDTVSRFGGDEFVLLLTDITSPHAAEAIATKLERALAEPIVLAGHELPVTTSIGITLYPQDGQDAPTLLKNADTAMYRAKERGRNNYQFYRAEMNERAMDRLALETELRKALDRREFEVYYQPRIDLRTGRIVGMEALIRWQHPERGMVSPGQFIPVAEESGLIGPIGEWVLETACHQVKRWAAAGFEALRVSVNISARQFNQPDLLKRIDTIIEESGIAPSQLELELTETLIMQHADTTIEVLKRLKSRGIYVAVDDFGTGYSSLSYLKRFPIDILKIDQSFIRDIPSDPDDAAIAETILALGHSLRLEVIAEGVETKEQLDFLVDRGCDAVQGFYFSRPIPTDQFTRLLESGRQVMQTAS